MADDDNKIQVREYPKHESPALRFTRELSKAYRENAGSSVIASTKAKLKLFVTRNRVSQEDALRMLLDYVASGRVTMGGNPYAQPEVQAALKALGNDTMGTL